MSADKPVDDSKNGSGRERSAGRVARHRMRIAWMYFVEGLTQSEIADRLGIGRVTVVRNINEALQRREVRIWITGNSSSCFELQEELKKRFGLVDASVAPDPAYGKNTPKVVGNAAGIWISEHVRDRMRIGVGWGATLAESLQTLDAGPLGGVEVVSLLGGIVHARRFNPSEFAWQFANALGADCYLLAAPALVDSEATKKTLLEQCGLNAVLDRAKELDMVLLSVGAMSPESTTFRIGFFSEQDRLSLLESRAVGDLLLNFYDIHGEILKNPVNQRVMSAAVEQLRLAKLRVIVSGGDEKIDALMGGMRLVKCNVLITNESTARGLLARAAATDTQLLDG